MRTLIVEDESELAEHVRDLLLGLNGIVDIVETVVEATEAVRNFKYDLAIVDRRLPDGDAIRMVRALSSLTDRPAIVFLTARDATTDIIEGLDAGADDYLTKPFEPGELLARLRAVLRRPRSAALPIVSLGNVELDIGTNRAMIDGNEVLLRRREALLLEALLIRQGRVITRETLASSIYGFNDEIESNSLEAQISRIRRKLNDNNATIEIRSIRGVGYIIRRMNAS